MSYEVNLKFNVFQIREELLSIRLKECDYVEH
jgi:hypothetical protein